MYSVLPEQSANILLRFWSPYFSFYFPPKDRLFGALFSCLWFSKAARVCPSKQLPFGIFDYGEFAMSKPERGIIS